MKKYFEIVKALFLILLILYFYSCETGTEPTKENLNSTNITLKLSLAEVHTEIDSIVCFRT